MGMAKKPKTEVETLAEMARAPAFTDVSLREAVQRLVRKNPEFGRALIAEALDVRRHPKRFLSLDEERKWLDMAGISALAVVESIENELRVSEGEGQEDLLGPVAPEMIRDEREEVASRALQVLREVEVRSRELEALLKANQKALQMLALLIE
jgi:hypothetical protein